MRLREKAIEVLLLTCASIAILIVFGIVLMLFMEGIPIFYKVSLWDFIFGDDWYPTSSPPDFGILPLLVGSAVITLGALIVGVPLGLGSAIYLSQIASPRVRELLKPILEILASIPSVVYGFFGMAFFGPLVMNVFSVPVGLNAFTASVILGVMIVPTVASVAEDAMSSVPRDLIEASYALGATRWRTIVKIVMPTASSGIITSILLGLGRAAGETMTVLMVAGGSPQIPRSIFDPVRTMTATIAAEMGEAPVGSSHYHALFAIGMLLFFITFAFNFLAERFAKRRIYL